MVLIRCSISTFLVAALHLKGLAAQDPVAAAEEENILLEGLARDEAACEAGTEACGLELVQLRAHRRATEEEPKDAAGKATEAAVESAEEAGSEPSSNFGPDVEGENMWEDVTWEAVLAQFGGNTSYTKASKEPHGGSDNVPDADADDILCPRDTYGTCSVTRCDESRGPSRCDRGRCLCQPDHCAFGGACYPRKPQACKEDTGGTCTVTWCRSWRGTSACDGGKCMCKKGGCAWAGRCVPMTDTGGTCDYVSCSPSRGPSTCHRGRCLCQRGYIATGGRCEKMAWAK